jgi:nicotinamidase-related amidase
VARHRQELPNARPSSGALDAQNHFVAEGFPLEVLARAIVSNINRQARAPRSRAASRTSAARSIIGPNRSAALRGADKARILRLLAQMGKSRSLGRELRQEDKCSDFINGSCDLDAKLRNRGIENLLVTGTLTNVARAAFTSRSCSASQLLQVHSRHGQRQFGGTKAATGSCFRRC